VQLVWGRGKTRIEIERLQTELAQQTGRAGRAEADREALRAELDRVGGELTAAVQQAQRLTTEHAKHVAAWTLRAEVAERRAEDLVDQLAQAETDLAAARLEVDRLQADRSSAPEPATEPKQSQPPTSEPTDRPNPSRGQRQQPSRRRRGRPAGG